MANQTYHVFLSHNSADKPAVEELARRLCQVGLHPWLDMWNLIPGEPWQEAIESALEQCDTCAVFIGTSGTGPWQNEEMRAAIERRVRESQGHFRVIPVLLPGAERGERSHLPTFLVRSTWVEFRRTLDDECAFHRLLCGIRGVAPGPGPSQAIYAGTCPYRGLHIFDVSDARFFFGREALTEWLLNELQPEPLTREENRFLAIIGPSGSGKSSLARAGLIAALRDGAIKGSQNWRFAICKPGVDPLESVAIALCDAIGVGQNLSTVQKVMNAMQQSERGLHRSVRVALRKDPADQRMVLLLDQFEEIFTLCRDENVRRALIDNLLYATSVAGDQTIVLLTLRADFYGKCAVYPALAAALSEHQMLVGPMTDDELRHAIECPAQLVGCEFESGLVETLLEDVQHQPGALPLLQHALMELWGRCEGRKLTHMVYQEIGGLRGALERRAETIFARFSPEEQAICKQIFLRLTQPGENTEDTRRRAAFQELLPASGECAQVEAVMGALADARLITTEGDEIGRSQQFAEVMGALADARLITTEGDEIGRTQQFAEVAHEALIRNWPRLRAWVDESRETLLAHRRLTEAAREWERHGRDESYLYRGARLDEAQQLASSGGLNVLEQAFVEAGVAAQRRNKRRWHLLQFVALSLTFATIVIASALRTNFVKSQTVIDALTSPWQRLEGIIVQQPEGLNFVDPVVSLAYVDGQEPTYYAGTESIGFGRSRDGLAWSFFDDGLPKVSYGDPQKRNKAIGRVAIDPIDHQRIFAYVLDSGVFKSENGGQQWNAAGNEQLPKQTVRDLAVYGNHVLAVFKEGVYASTDGGNNWQQIEDTVGFGEVYAVHMTRDGGTVYLGTKNGLYRSPVDTWATWNWRPVSLDGPLSVELIVPGVGGDDSLYLATVDEQYRGTIYRFRTRDQQVTPLPGGIDEQVQALAPATDAVYVLLKNGAVWSFAQDRSPELLGQPPGFALDLAAVPRADGSTWLLMGHASGLLKYRDSQN